MSDFAMGTGSHEAHVQRPEMDRKPHVAGAAAFGCVLLAGLLYAAYSISVDMAQVGEHNLAVGALALLGLALLIALGFEFVNGFHDTANAVATVIYTHSLSAAGCGRLVRHLQPAWRPVVQRCGRLYGGDAAAGGTDPAGGQWRRGMP